MGESPLLHYAAGFVLALALVLSAAFTTGPMDYEPVAAVELPPLRDVTMTNSLWERDPKAFQDPPGERSWGKVA